MDHDHAGRATSLGMLAESVARGVMRCVVVRVARRGVAVVLRCMLSVKATTKLSSILLGCVTFPLGGMLVLLHEKMFDVAETWAVFGLVFSLVLLVPLAKFIAYVVVLKDVREVNALCLEVRSGNYRRALMLPPEGEEENEIIRLKRNLNWMVHAIACREDWLQCRLDKTAAHKKKYETLSMVDGLTGVYNRRFFDEQIKAYASRAHGAKRGFFLLLIDCDHFKQVNDTLGHEAGDDLLRSLGEILKTSLRGATDCPFRYGGDEFGVLFGDMPRERVLEVAERIRVRFIDQRVGQATLSMGLARFISGESVEASLKDLKRRADAALYRAKAQGRNQVVSAEEKSPQIPADKKNS